MSDLAALEPYTSQPRAHLQRRPSGHRHHYYHSHSGFHYMHPPSLFRSHSHSHSHLPSHHSLHTRHNPHRIHHQTDPWHRSSNVSSASASAALLPPLRW